jgi:hypothetical protein
VKKPRIVLEEDDFTGDLEKIIVRDYFPEVPRLKVNLTEFITAISITRFRHSKLI